MRIILASFFIFLTVSVFGQSKWEYGINLNFNTSFIKPVSSDTLTNKAGFGAGLMLERKFKKFSLQYNQSYVQTRYYHDFDNYTSISNAAEASLLVMHPLDAKRQTFLNYGLITTLNFLYDERHLNGFNIPNRNTQIEKNRFDYGIQVGVGLDLNPGTRLTINYMDYFGGKQSSNNIQGQVDYLQFGVQVRFNELLNSDRINNKTENLEQSVNKASQQVDDLSKEGEGVLIFVIGTTESNKASLFNPKTLEEREALRAEKINNIWNAINANYDYGSFVVTTDSLLNSESRDLTVLTADGEGQYNTASKKIYYAKIDELFLSESGQVKWGIFVFDGQMNLLQEPFPYFTPYRQLDQKFETSDAMIKTFNLRLKQFGVVQD